MGENNRSSALTEVTLFVLLATYQPRHGYGIMKYVLDITNGRLNLGAGTLYGSIKQLKAKNWIVEVESKQKEARGKVEYLITELGKEAVKEDYQRMKEICNIITDLEGL